MVRLIVSLLVGGAVTFGLFVIMAMLIANSGRPPEKPGPSPVIDIVMPNQDSNLNQIQRTPPPPPPPPPEPPKLEPAEPDNADADADINLGDIDLGIEGPNIEISGPGAMRADGEATPIVRIDPKYPVQAARDGREGWVRLSFTINEAGGVEDVKVMEAEPRRIFDREAVRALKKWKYKPRIENGKPVKQFNQKVQLDFTLEK